MEIVHGVKSDSFGASLDTGNYSMGHAYAEMAEVTPYAANVQIKVEVRTPPFPKHLQAAAKVKGDTVFSALETASTVSPTKVFTCATFEKAKQAILSSHFFPLKQVENNTQSD